MAGRRAGRPARVAARSTTLWIRVSQARYPLRAATKV